MDTNIAVVAGFVERGQHTDISLNVVDIGESVCITFSGDGTPRLVDMTINEAERLVAKLSAVIDYVRERNGI